MNFLSFIVPAYNVESYIERCIASIYSQDLEIGEFETIIVDDGSTDGTASLVRSLIVSGKYPKLSLVSQENKGISSARNNGIAKAVGKYVWCVDSDDYLVKNSCRPLVDLLHEHDCDILFFEFCLKYYKDEKTSITCRQGLSKYVPMKGSDAIIGNYQPCSACSAIMRRSFIESKQLRFYEGLYHEDVEFMYRAVALARTVMFTDICPYIYELHPNSRSTATDITKVIKRLTDNCIIANSFIRFADSVADEDVRQRIIRMGHSICLGTITQLVTKKSHRQRMIQKAVIDTFREYDLFPLKTPGKSIKRMLLVAFLNLRFSL